MEKRDIKFLQWFDELCTRDIVNDTMKPDEYASMLSIRWACDASVISGIRKRFHEKQRKKGVRRRKTNANVTILNHLDYLPSRYGSQLTISLERYEAPMLMVHDDHVNIVIPMEHVHDDQSQVRFMDVMWGVFYHCVVLSGIENENEMDGVLYGCNQYGNPVFVIGDIHVNERHKEFVQEVVDAISCFGLTARTRCDLYDQFRLDNGQVVTTYFLTPESYEEVLVHGTVETANVLMEQLYQIRKLENECRPTCQKCGERALLMSRDRFKVKFHRERADIKKIYYCDCDEDDPSYVSCHGVGSETMGTLADKRTRQARQDGHKAFDAMRKRCGYKRQQTYDVLAQLMGMTKEQCHFGMFDYDTCQTAIGVMNAHS
jgi:hypothetical protein